MTADGYLVERTRGVPAGREDEVRTFWSSHSALGAGDMDARLPLLAGLVVDPQGAIAGTCSVVDTKVPLIGNRRFWVYRRLLGPDVPTELDAALFRAVFDDLDREHEPGADCPIGMCAIDQPRPEAKLPASALFLAGYMPTGEQVRLRYFEGARIR